MQVLVSVKKETHLSTITMQCGSLDEPQTILASMIPDIHIQ
jgi:hypothetical protein